MPFEVPVAALSAVRAMLCCTGLCMQVHFWLSQVSGNNLDWLEPQQAGLRMLSLDMLQRDHMEVNYKVAGICYAFEALPGCMHTLYSAEMHFSAL